MQFISIQTNSRAILYLLLSFFPVAHMHASNSSLSAKECLCPSRMLKMVSISGKIELQKILPFKLNYDQDRKVHPQCENKPFDFITNITAKFKSQGGFCIYFLTTGKGLNSLLKQVIEWFFLKKTTSRNKRKQLARELPRANQNLKQL